MQKGGGEDVKHLQLFKNVIQKKKNYKADEQNHLQEYNCIFLFSAINSGMTFSSPITKTFEILWL